ITSMFNNNGVIWQSGELGKVDGGGGGTIDMYIGNLNMDVIDCGVPVLSMHAPFEVTAKSDIYMAYKAYKVFFTER
ncbi:MAG: aminopeptidase, partial [Clostridia bacterium]|nr:aminopeptidase [Clostridia bacterium]